MHNPTVPPPATLALSIDRTGPTSLTEQIRSGIAEAIARGVLVPGARLPSWQDLSIQLGVARGTVRSAYAALADEQLVVASPIAGTRVAPRPRPGVASDLPNEPLPGGYQYYGGPASFRNGVPPRDLFPAKVFARLHAHAARAAAAVPDRYPDPRGEDGLRRAIAAHLAIARGIACVPDQVFVTGGFLGGLAIVLRILVATDAAVWTEDPCFPIARGALRLAGLRPVPVPVDREGIVVAEGVRRAPAARAALVTPGQQAPLGMTLSPARRSALLGWASDKDAWVIEDDYLAELQLRGRAAPALAAADPDGRVIHLGSFSKTISPTLRVGFVVVPPALVGRFTDACAYAGAVPNSAIQHAVAAFLTDGHYLRHLRRIKHALAGRAALLCAELAGHDLRARIAGLAALVDLPPEADDAAIAAAATAFGLAPAPLSQWFADPAGASRGLLLGVASQRDVGIAGDCRQLAGLILAAQSG